VRRVQRGGATMAESLEAGAHLVAGSGSGMVRTAAQPSCLETEPSLMWYAAVMEMNAPRTGTVPRVATSSMRSPSSTMVSLFSPPPTCAVESKQ